MRSPPSLNLLCIARKPSCAVLALLTLQVRDVRTTADIANPPASASVHDFEPRRWGAWGLEDTRRDLVDIGFHMTTAVVVVAEYGQADPHHAV